MHRGWKPLLATAVVVLAAGCGAPGKPEVTFYSHGESVAAAPTQHCEPRGGDCSSDPEAAEQLRVPPGEPVQISVPQEVAEAPWQVAFVYRGTDGAEVDQRSPVFAPGERHAYTLRLPPGAAQLEHVEVQRYSAVLAPGAEGGVNFVIGGAWVVDATR
ncbi:DUF2771 family protein [Salinifilum ghardaiensis]